MLTPDYLDSIEFNDVVQLYNKLNIEITADIIERVSQMQEITATTKEQLKILLQTNGTEVFNEALEKTSMLTAETKKALKVLFENVAKEDLQGYKELYEYKDKVFKLSETQLAILNAGLQQTNKTLKNLTNTIAFQSQQAYINAVDEAYMKVASGAFSYDTAINTAVQQLADKGITLKDSLGRNVQLEVAVRRNVMTGIRETANKVSRDIEKNLGCDGYEVTAHMGARPTHAAAQGKQYAINKEDAGKYKVGLWSDVEKLWSEYNCRHSYFGIILGVSEPIYTDKELKEFKNATVTLNGKEVPYYEATQKQRQLENAIRKQKRAVQTLEKANMDSTVSKSKLAKLQKQYKDFCKETGLEKDYGRIKVAVSTNSNTSGIINKTNLKDEGRKLQYIGKLDKNKLGNYKDKITTNDVIMTNERIEHTKIRHPGDYEKYIEYVPDIIRNPDYILEDKDNKDTILTLKTIKEKNKNIQVVVKLQTNIEEKDKSNSILTFWHIRDRNYKSTIKNNKIIYQKLDKNE